MTEHTAVILLAIALTTLTAALVGMAAAYLARRDHATWSRAVTRAATAFAAALTLASVLAATLHTLTR